MKPGETFETKCYTYLKNSYRNKGTEFYKEGGMNSTKSDIAVVKNGQITFYIEAKDSHAQSGQFVLIPNEETETFVFSPRNRSTPNEMTDMIIAYMNRSFHKFNNAGTAGESLSIDNTIFAQWIVDYYKSKNVKYVISYGGNFVIFPIRKFKDYFQISATYRIKKSGSDKPAKRDFGIVKQEIINSYPTATFSVDGQKLFARISEPLSKDRFPLGKYTYYFSRQSANLFEIRRLSNTYNMNVIFSIDLIKSQDVNDLNEFEADI